MENKLATVAHALGPLSRSAAVLMFSAAIYLAAVQDTDRHTPVFRGLTAFVFSMIGFIFLAGLVVLAVGLAIKCPSCRHRRTFIGPRNPKHSYPLSVSERFASFFWPTHAYLEANQCTNCGHFYRERRNDDAKSPNL